MWQTYGRNASGHKHRSGPLPQNTGFRFLPRISYAQNGARVSAIWESTCEGKRGGLVTLLEVVSDLRVRARRRKGTRANCSTSAKAQPERNPFQQGRADHITASRQPPTGLSAGVLPPRVSVSQGSAAQTSATRNHSLLPVHAHGLRILWMTFPGVLEMSPLPHSVEAATIGEEIFYVIACR